MPNESLNIYLTAVDKASPVLASITDKTKALDKESQQLQQTYEALQKANKGLIERKTELQKKLQEVNEEVEEARKSFRELGDEASSDAYEKAQEKQQKLRNEIAATTKALGENQKMYKENIETIRKNTLGEESSGSDLSAIWGGLGIGEAVSSLVGQMGSTLASSALGDGMGSMVSGALSNAISGAALGTAISPGVGTAIGAAVGGLSGMVSGAIEQWGSKDDAFKDYYGGLYEDVKGRSGEMVEAGTSLASTRETNRISFTTLFDGDESRARTYLEDLTDMANSTPFLYDDLVSMSKTLATYGYDDNNILPLLETIGDAGAALGMSTSDMNSVAQALGRMKSSDKATLEYLNMLNDRGIGAVGMLAEAKGVSQGNMYGMISRGEISGTEAVEIITEALARSKEEGGYAGSMYEQSQTFAGVSSTLEGLQQNLNALGGEKYNSLRQEGKDAEVNALKGDLGTAMGEINAIMGENQARRENLEEQYRREVLNAVLNGEQGELWSKFSEDQQNALTQMSQEYAALKERYDESEGADWEAGVELEKLYETALTMGQSYFDASDEVQRLNEIEIDEITMIRENTAGLMGIVDNIYQQTQELSKGLGSVVHLGGETENASNYASRRDYAYRNKEDEESAPGHIKERRDMQKGRHAFGLDRVPYDEYPALLHEGERVLTAAQARAQDAGQWGGPPVQLMVTGNSFVGTSEEMVEQLWAVIVRRLEQEAVARAPK